MYSVTFSWGFWNWSLLEPDTIGNQHLVTLCGIALQGTSHISFNFKPWLWPAWWHPVTYATLVSELGIRKAPHARTSRGYHKYIEFILNSASSGVHVIALRKSTYFSNKKKQSAIRQGVSHPPASASHLYTIQWQEPARNPDKCPLHIWHWAVPIDPRYMPTQITPAFFRILT